MKAIMSLVSLLLIGLSAMAATVTEESSWEEIMTAPGLYVDWPKIQFNSTFVPVVSVCTTGEAVVADVPVCYKYEEKGEGELVCVDRRIETVTKGLIETRQICVEWGGEGDCIRYANYESTIALNYEVDVYELEGGEGDWRAFPLFSKPFDIPYCE